MSRLNFRFWVPHLSRATDARRRAAKAGGNYRGTGGGDQRPPRAVVSPGGKGGGASLSLASLVEVVAAAGPAPGPGWPMGDDPPPLGSLGWRGKFQHDSPEVVRLRETLEQEGGIRGGLEIVDPSTPGFAERAAKLFRRDGHVVVRDVLGRDRIERIKAGCDTVIREFLRHDPARIGTRGSHRYAFANAPAHFGQSAAWAALIDAPVALAVVEAIFESPLFACSGWGGDFVLPGAVEFQQ